jgi:SpoVK/Ycf46/Vps4 family AAA+-type ATPase
MAVFTRPAAKSELTPADFAFVAEDAQVLTTLLGNAVRAKAAGVNVLLYGPPGTGKTELARVCAREAGLELFEVEYADRDGNSLSGRDRYRSLQISQVFLKSSPDVALLFDEVEYADRDGNSLSGRDRYRSLQISQVFLKSSPDVALLFDEVEDVFPPVSADAAQLLARLDASDAPASASVSGKAWVNQILETNPVPVIWVTNRIEQIDPAFRRRFQYHLELKSPPPGAREALVLRALAGVSVGEGFASRLSERRGLTPAQVRTAVRFAQLAARDGDAVEPLIERQLGNADRALGRAAKDEHARRVVTRYDLGLLNIECRFEVARIVEALRRRGHGTLCFHGPPGTGKTALAEHIASELQRPLLVRQASDLVSKFVGETEQNMARMFEEAQAEGALLLLDEADSFLRSRQRAERNYEVTEVNEMLQGMERFGGLFVCTTNLFDELDEAALRRFTFKVRFKPLAAVQREAMFVAEALGGDGAALTAEQRTRLAALDQLAPGDFAAVQRQVEILGAPFKADEFLAQLESEHRVKPGVRERRAIGFSAETR